jgi:hypothetical protein
MLVKAASNRSTSQALSRLPSTVASRYE